MKKCTKPDGYIALMSAIVIASVLLIVAFSVSYNSFSARFNLLDSYNKETSFQMAQTCLNMAALRLLKDPANLSGETIILNSHNCIILPITGSNPSYTIKTSSNIGNTHTNLEAIFNTFSATITSWKEVAEH